MRVLVKDVRDGVTCVLNINYASYDDDITEVKDSNKEYDRYNKKLVTGLYILDFENNEMYIPDVSEKDCDKACRELMVSGYCDLTQYGGYYMLDIDEENI